MTPFELDILLHYYSSASEHEAVLNNVPIWPETREWFLRSGLLEPHASDHGASYRTTEKARVFIEYIMSLPLPVQEWKMP